MTTDIADFVRESNYIDGIVRTPFREEIDAHIYMLEAHSVTIELLEEFVTVIHPGALLREWQDMNLIVGTHTPPLGGPDIKVRLRKILRAARKATPYHIYCAFQHLHPFMAANGRSGRALWLRMMRGPENAPLGFLRHFHIQALQAGDVQ